jgi:hypothetical protein
VGYRLYMGYISYIDYMSYSEGAKFSWERGYRKRGEHPGMFSREKGYRGSEERRAFFVVKGLHGLHELVKFLEVVGGKGEMRKARNGSAQGAVANTPSLLPKALDWLPRASSIGCQARIRLVNHFTDHTCAPILTILAVAIFVPSGDQVTPIIADVG